MHLSKKDAGDAFALLWLCWIFYAILCLFFGPFMFGWPGLMVKPCCSGLQCTQQHMVQLFPMKTCLSPHHSFNNSVADCYNINHD